MKLKPSPISGYLSTGHWYNSDGSLSDEYRAQLLESGYSPDKIERMNQTARREFKFREEFLRGLKAQSEKYDSSGAYPARLERARTQALDTLPPWELVSEGEVEPDELE